jgi:hypothetical protein
MCSIAFALRLRLDAGRRGNDQNVKTRNRGDRRVAGRLRIEFGRYHTVIRLAGRLSKLHLPAIGAGGSEHIDQGGVVVGRPGQPAHQRRLGDRRCSRRLLAGGILCRRRQADRGRAIQHEGPDGRRRTGVDREKMQYPVSGRAAAGDLIAGLPGPDQGPNELTLMTKLNLSTAERDHLEWNRGLTTNSDSDEILCGLNLAESVEYLDLTKRERPGDTKSRDRFLELHSRHEVARRSVIVAEVDARSSGPKH